MNAYFISGLGADQRAFYKIKLPAGYHSIHLNWIKPHKNETLPGYAARFSQLINAKEEFILIGLSFGGILASEIAKIIAPKKLIIISSLGSSKEQPWYFRLAGKLHLHKVITPAIYKRATVLHRFFGVGNKEMKAIVYNYVRNADPQFIRWALDVIVNWAHTERLPNLIHIHGSSDRLLPCRYVKADYIIPNGEHLMVMNKSDEVNLVLAKVLAA